LLHVKFCLGKFLIDLSRLKNPGSRRQGGGGGEPR
jgi:hypothetical protein